MNTVPISVIVLTLNETDNIGRCLEHLRWAGEVILVDSNSNDGTVQRAQAARPDIRVFSYDRPDFGEKRNWALDNTSPAHEWILFVDADEFCTEELAAEIDKFIREPSDYSGAYIAGRNYLGDTWLKHCTLYPSYQLRLLKRGCVRYCIEGHGNREVADGRLAYLKGWWRHEGFNKGLHNWYERHNRYTTDEVPLCLRLRREAVGWKTLFAGQPVERRREIKKIAARVPMRPLARFLYTMILRLGFLDGRAGLQYCQMQYAVDLMLSTKVKEALRAERQA